MYAAETVTGGTHRTQEPEVGGNVVDGGAANWDTMGWGYWSYPYVPSVYSWKWMDSRRMTNICERWSKNHTNALQCAYAHTSRHPRRAFTHVQTRQSAP